MGEGKLVLEIGMGSSGDHGVNPMHLAAKKVMEALKADDVEKFCVALERFVKLCDQPEEDVVDDGNNMDNSSWSDDEEY